jgi:hypothetical protein
MDNRDLMAEVHAFMKAHPGQYPPEQHESVLSHIETSLSKAGDAVRSGVGDAVAVPELTILVLVAMVSGRPLFGD